MSLTPRVRASAQSRTSRGFVFFGQFVDHDITSSLERQNDPEGIANFRTPLIELDSVYGSGPEVDPWLYDQSKGQEDKDRGEADAAPRRGRENIRTTRP